MRDDEIGRTELTATDVNEPTAVMIIKQEDPRERPWQRALKRRKRFHERSFRPLANRRRPLYRA